MTEIYNYILQELKELEKLRREVDSLESIIEDQDLQIDTLLMANADLHQENYLHRMAAIEALDSREPPRTMTYSDWVRVTF